MDLQQARILCQERGLNSPDASCLSIHLTLLSPAPFPHLFSLNRTLRKIYLFQEPRGGKK